MKSTKNDSSLNASYYSLLSVYGREETQQLISSVILKETGLISGYSKKTFDKALSTILTSEAVNILALYEIFKYTDMKQVRADAKEALIPILARL